MQNVPKSVVRHAQDSHILHVALEKKILIL